ncbi:MAG: hypothetical protein AAFR87_10230 [Bacteroidota bacterium]
MSSTQTISETKMKASVKLICYIASSLLIIMGIFHGSGINYLTEIVQDSNVSDLVKDIFPVLFIIPSIQLIGLAVLGIMVASMGKYAYRILLLLTILVLIDAILAFYLNALIPGLILSIPAFMFLFASVRLSSASHKRPSDEAL